MSRRGKRSFNQDARARSDGSQKDPDCYVAFPETNYAKHIFQQIEVLKPDFSLIIDSIQTLTSQYVESFAADQFRRVREVQTWPNSQLKFA